VMKHQRAYAAFRSPSANPPMQPFRTGLGRLDSQRLQPVRLEIVALVFCFLGSFAHALDAAHHKERQVIALAVRGARTYSSWQRESPTRSLLNPSVCSASDPPARTCGGISICLGVEELPNSTSLHKLHRFVFHFLRCLEHIVYFALILWRVVKYLPGFQLAAACCSFSRADTVSFKGATGQTGE